MPRKAKYKDWPEKSKIKARKASLQWWNKKKQDPEYMERVAKKRKEYNRRPEVLERKRLAQKEYYKKKLKEPGWYSNELKKISLRRRKKLEIPGFIENEREKHKKYENSIPGMAVRMLENVKKRTQKKEYEPITITKSWIIDKLNTGICEVTGIKFIKENGKIGAYTATLDRIDSTKGYTLKNTRMVIWAFNKAKGEWDEKILNDWINKYINYRKTNK